jgi:hypothetical protein
VKGAPAPEGPFRCPRCGETYAPHWHARDGSGLCRTCAAERDGRCQFANHPDHDSSCSYSTERPGEPCRYCAAPVPDDGPCRNCWQSFDELPLADIRAIFAVDGFDTTISTTPKEA